MNKIEKVLVKLLKKINKCELPETVHHVIFGDRLNPLKSLKKWRNGAGE